MHSLVIHIGLYRVAMHVLSSNLYRSVVANIQWGRECYCYFSTEQGNMYEEAAAPIVDNVMEGYNGAHTKAFSNFVGKKKALQTSTSSQQNTGFGTFVFVFHR